MRQQPDNSIDLTFGSPPYEAARTYGIGFKLKGQEWVNWMVERIVEMVRITNGLVAMVVEGQTRGYRWSATPALLMADLHRAGITLRKPPIYSRAGIPGSGGPDWLANRYEFIVCCTKGRRLPWSDNKAMGQPCKYGPGGVPSHRLSSGERVNLAKMRRMVESGLPQREAARICGVAFKTTTSGTGDNGTLTQNTYIPPEIANPGNIIHCSVGGGKMGSKKAHNSEAPFHEHLPAFFIKSFGRPGGVVLDPFVGSGTTIKAAKSLGRDWVGVDIREDQCRLSEQRLLEVADAS